MLVSAAVGSGLARQVTAPIMSYIDSNLLDGEHVVFRTRLHWLLFMGPVLFIVIVLLPVAWLLSSGTWFLASGTWGGYAWVPIGLAALILVATFIKRQSSDFAVTNKRVMMKVGVFSTRSIELLLNKIEAIAVEQTLLGRMFGYGDIVITGSGGTKEAFSRIQSPLEFRRAAIADWLVPGVPGSPGKGDHVAHIGKPRRVSHGALEAEPESRVRDRPVAAEVAIPAVVLLVEPGPGHAGVEHVEPLFALAAADDLADARREHIHRRNRFSVVVDPHVERLDLLRVVHQDHRLAGVLFGDVAFVL